MMTKFMLAVTVFSCVLASITLSADESEDPMFLKPAAANLNGVYAKMLLPYDPNADVVEGDSTVAESWVIQSIDKEQRQADHRAVTGWVRLVNKPFEGTPMWRGGTLDGVALCHVGADFYERKDGLIQIEFRGWTPGGAFTKVTLKDEPGTRVVVPVTEAKSKHGTPHVAIFVSVPAK